MAEPIFIRPDWKKKDLIRDIRTGKPYLVLHVHVHICTLVVDLNSASPATPLVLLPRDYPNFTLDRNMHCEERNGELVWAYEPLGAML